MVHIIWTMKIFERLMKFLYFGIYIPRLSSGKIRFITNIKGDKDSDWSDFGPDVDTQCQIRPFNVRNAKFYLALYISIHQNVILILHYVEKSECQINSILHWNYNFELKIKIDGIGGILHWGTNAI